MSPKKTESNAGRHNNRGLIACAWTFLLTGGLFSARAEGFRDATIGTFDLGRSGGRIAQVDDATAVQNNPGNLVDVTNTQVLFSPSVIYINVDYQSPNGAAASTVHPLKVLPNIFVSTPLAGDRLVAGLGVTVPYGLGNQWDKSSAAFRPGGPLYNAANFGKLTTFNFNPTLSAKLGDHLQLGVGLDVMWSDLELRQLAFPVSPTTSAEVHGDGTGLGVGGNLGITWKITDRQRLALTYRSGMTVDYSGSVRLENYPGTPSTYFGSQIKYPNIMQLGYGIELTDKIRLESDVEWVQFSQFKNLGVTAGNLPAVGNITQNIAENWHDTFTAGFGGDWQFADHWVVRAGYQFFESPVPDSTFSPTIPDANQNVFTVGLGWKGKRNSLEFAYGLDFYDDRNITTPENPIHGKYTFNVHLFSLAYTLTF
jgi:long-chain fatty acid transport protein